VKRAGKFFLLFVILLGGVIRLFYLMEPVDINNHQVVDLIINKGSSSEQIAEELYSSNLIRSKFVFNLLLFFKGIDDNLKAGFYQFKPSYNIREVISIIHEGRVATFKVTIPEGFTLDDIAERMAELTPYSKETFLEDANSFDYSLEGFLYPDTYIIPKDFTPEQIFEVMYREFKEKWLERLEDETKDSRYSPLDIVVIASLVEKEAKLAEEKPVIAAVIFNRLNQEMLLQIDASIQYALPTRKERVLYSDLQFDSPYNTYLYTGLPPGPICSPGDASIEATLNPESNDYLFYFALPDGSHVFSRTYQEHLLLQKKMGVKNE